MTFFACADRRGVIEILGHVPSGLLVIADDPNQQLLSDVIEGEARHAYDGTTLLVPGIPEAASNDDALDALIAFRRRVLRALANAGGAPS